MCIFIFLLLPLNIFAYFLANNSLDRIEVKREVDNFLTKERGFIQRGLNNAFIYLPIVEEIFEKKNLPHELIYLPLIESAYSVRAYSRAGACGIWQFMNGTARWYNLRNDFWVDERRDYFKSTKKAAQYLKDLFNYYNGWELALAAYNAGMGSVNHAIKKAKSKDYWKLCELELLKRETREYVPRFIAASIIGMNYEKYGFAINRDIKFPDFEILKVEKPVDLTILGRNTGISLNSLKFLNPELKRLITPFGRIYNLRVPKNYYAKALSVYLELPYEKLVSIKYHIVRPGETLGEIAQKYSSDIYLLKRINNISNPRRIYAGEKLVIPLSCDTKKFENETIFIPKIGYNDQEISYTIQKGDTIWNISKTYKADIETLLYINGLSFDSIIYPGDDIKILLEIALRR